MSTYTCSKTVGHALAVVVLTVATVAAQAPADLERFTVLEDRTKPQGRTIELAFARLKTTATIPGPPLVYLDGGPGGSGVGAYRIDEYRRLFDAMRAIGDVILLSQRGTGFSTPRLTCQNKETAPADLFLSAQRMIEVLGPLAIRCAAALRDHGIDLAAYNTDASADDLEDLRVVLKARKLNLFGFSYGTHLALAAVRRHPASIDRLILAGTEGPDDSLKYPHTFDLQLARLSQIEASRRNAPAPNLVDMTRTVLAKLEQSPVEAGTFTVGKEGFQYLLRRDIGDTNDTASVIQMIRDTARGDYGLLSKFAERRHSGFSNVGMMGAAMDCASGSSPERMARIERERQGSLLGIMTNFPFPQICEAIRALPLPEAFRSPIISNVPALFISGSLDSNTPPYQAEQVRWGFPNSAHLIVENAGHESTLVPEAQKAMLDFLKGLDVAGRTLTAPSPLK